METASIALDPTDREIVRLLMNDGRLTQEQIAKEVHLSRPAVHERIRKLEAHGVIRGYRARVDWELIGLPVSAFVFLETTGKCYEVAHRIWDLSTEQAVVQDCQRIIGEWCLLLHVRTVTIGALDKFLDQLVEVDGVVRKQTTIALADCRSREDDLLHPRSKE